MGAVYIPPPLSNTSSRPLSSRRKKETLFSAVNASPPLPSFIAPVINPLRAWNSWKRVHLFERIRGYMLGNPIRLFLCFGGGRIFHNSSWLKSCFGIYRRERRLIHLQRKIIASRCAIIVISRHVVQSVVAKGLKERVDEDGDLVWRKVKALEAKEHRETRSKRSRFHLYVLTIDFCAVHRGVSRGKEILEDLHRSTI